MRSRRARPDNTCSTCQDVRQPDSTNPSARRRVPSTGSSGSSGRDSDQSWRVDGVLRGNKAAGAEGGKEFIGVGRRVGERVRVLILSTFSVRFLPRAAFGPRYRCKVRFSRRRLKGQGDLAASLFGV